MVSMRSYASIALCILFALLVSADQGNGMEGDRQTSMNVQAKGAPSRKEVSVAGDGKRIIGVRKMLVAKKGEGKNGETSILSDAIHDISSRYHENDHQENKDLKRISKNFGVDVFSPLVETTDYNPPKQHPPTHKGKNAMKSPGGSDNTSNYQNNKREVEEEEWKAKETDKTGGMNLINEDYQYTPRKPPVHD